jgi:hypothetical protein
MLPANNHDDVLFVVRAALALILCGIVAGAAHSQCTVDATLETPPFASGWSTRLSDTAVVSLTLQDCDAELAASSLTLEIRGVDYDPESGIFTTSDSESVRTRLNESGVSYLLGETTVTGDHHEVGVRSPGTLVGSLQIGILVKEPIDRGEGIIYSPAASDLWIVWVENGFDGPLINVGSSSVAVDESFELDTMSLAANIRLDPTNLPFNPWTTIRYCYDLKLEHTATNTIKIILEDQPISVPISYSTDYPIEHTMLDESWPSGAGNLVLDVSRCDETVYDGELEENQVSLGEVCSQPDDVTDLRRDAQNHFKFVWSTVTGADGYIVVVKDETSSARQTLLVDGNEVTLSGLTAGSNVQLRIRSWAECESGLVSMSSWTDTSFVVPGVSVETILDTYLWAYPEWSFEVSYDVNADDGTDWKLSFDLPDGEIDLGEVTGQGPVASGTHLLTLPGCDVNDISNCWSPEPIRWDFEVYQSDGLTPIPELGDSGTIDLVRPDLPYFDDSSLHCQHFSDVTAPVQTVLPISGAGSYPDFQKLDLVRRADFSPDAELGEIDGSVFWEELELDPGDWTSLTATLYLANISSYLDTPEGPLVFPVEITDRYGDQYVDTREETKVDIRFWRYWPEDASWDLPENATAKVIPAVIDYPPWKSDVAILLLERLEHEESLTETLLVEDFFEKEGRSSSCLPSKMLRLVRTITPEALDQGHAFREQLGNFWVKRRDNVVATSFYHSNRMGWLRVWPARRNDSKGLVASDNLVHVTSRTYSTSEGKNYGQYLPAVSTPVTAEGIILQQLTRSSQFRTNIGLVNTCNAELGIVIDIFPSHDCEPYEAPYCSHGQETVTVPAYTWWQQGGLIDGSCCYAFAKVKLSEESAAGTGCVGAYASVVDNDSDDPTFIVPVEQSTELWVAAAAFAGGTGGSQWRSDLEIHNPATNNASITLKLLVNQEYQSLAVVQVASGTSKRRLDVVQNTFGFISSTVGAIKVTSETAPGVKESPAVQVTSRLYNQPGGDATTGTYGQYIPGVTTGAAIRTGEIGWLLQLAGNEEEKRTNIGLFNATDSHIDVEIGLFDVGQAQPQSTLVVIKGLAGLTHHQFGISRYLSPVEDGFAVVRTTTERGLLFAYASVVDGDDPIYIPAAVLEPIAQGSP